jgi:predicted Zn-ribbon and HTH transcriptional regulator
MSQKPVTSPVKKPVHCGDCGWKGKRLIPAEAAYQPEPCPRCGSRSVYETPKY